MRMRLTVGIALLLGVVAHAQVTNLAVNGSFEADEAILDDPEWLQWATWGDGDGLNTTIAVDSAEYIDGLKSLRVNPQGAENWHFILLYLPVATTNGTAYTASFWAKAEEGRPLGAQFKATDNTASWGYADFTLTDQWAEYSLTAPAESVELKVELFCAASAVPHWFDFLNVYEGDYVAGVLPSQLVAAVYPTGKLPILWGELKAGR